MEEIGFNYAKLRGRIVEMVGSNCRFAEEMGITNRCLSNKLNGNSEWRQSDILAACDVLSIDLCDIATYFFAKKVKKS